MMSLLLDEVALAAARLAEAGVESPRTDAELIAASVHGVRRGELHTVPDSAFDARFWADIARRAAREPLQHITGQAYFRYLELEVGPGVFVPRPETEVMTGWAIARLGEMDVAEPVVADLGTGSGAIALAIGQEVPRARVHAVEADPLARARAERNITRYVESVPYTAGRVMLHAGDFGDVLGDLDGTVDLVISNPPYIPVGASVPPEVGEYDPPAALWSGADGLTAIRAVERTARRLLRPGGLVAVEHGAQQGAAVYWVFPEESGWRDTRNNKDLAGRDRFVTSTWSSEGARDDHTLRLPEPAVAHRRGRRRRGGGAGGRADRVADRYGLRHRRGRVHPLGRHHHAGGQGPRPEHAAARARRHGAGRRGAGGRSRRVRAGPDRRVLARRAHPGVPRQPDAALGPW
jgi:release factor glutamine methyltransferase